MPQLEPTTLAVIVSLLICAPQIWGLVQPEKMAAFFRGLARNVVAGYILIAIGTIWFVVVLENENLADFGVYKGKMQVFFVLLGIGACYYLKDYLAVRGIAIVLMLLAKLVIETVRLEDTGWRIPFILFAYIWIICGIVFTVSPWRFRDAMDWKYSNVQRTKKFCAIRLVVGLVLLVAGLTAFKHPAIAGN
tara:strand:+ start:1312 stop:1884 length:573 start_codon:yes stop_codon:yes gene_type:complete